MLRFLVRPVIIALDLSGRLFSINTSCVWMANLGTRLIRIADRCFTERLGENGPCTYLYAVPHETFGHRRHVDTLSINAASKQQPCLV